MSPLDRLDWVDLVAVQAVPEQALRLAMLLAARAREDGRAIASLPALATRMQVHKDTVRRAARALEKAGLIYIAHGRGRGNASSYYLAAPQQLNGKRLHTGATFFEGEAWAKKGA